MSIINNVPNPYRPGNGHMPPFLAGRDKETSEFSTLLDQDVVLQNVIITGLRGIGKTVLLNSFRPLAHSKQWLWAGTDCSESISVSEESIALRLITDIALLTSSIKIADKTQDVMGFSKDKIVSETYLDFETLSSIYRSAPGFVADKLKFTLQIVWNTLQVSGIKGVVFAYDEAQTLSDHAEDKQYPLSVLLDVFSYLQKNGVPFMLVLTGLPTLMPLLVNTRTYSERLFHVLFLDRLSDEDSRAAIIRPLEESQHPLIVNDASIDLIIKHAGGYPYFIQFMCREAYDIFEQQMSKDEIPSVPIDAIIQKLDIDFFAGRWARATDREKELLMLAALVNKHEFTTQQIMTVNETHPEIKPYSSSQLAQMLNRLIDAGLIFRNRRGIYSFAVPLLERYILRTFSQNQALSNGRQIP